MERVFGMRRGLMGLLVVASLALLAAGCGGGKGDGAAANGEAGAQVALNGAGATFPYPLYSKWFAAYGKAAPNVRINYQSVGSGAGIRGIKDRTVDFGASDAPASDQELQKMAGPVVHVPTALGAVVVTYNLPEAPDMRLTPEVLADIFLGRITSWDDARIAAANPGKALPKKNIAVMHRSDGSGTTYVFTDYLSAVSPDWKGKVGTGKSVDWPVGVGAKGNDGVTQMVKQTPGAVGYVELTYAEQQKLPYASLKNRAGKFVKPSLDAVSAAAAGALDTMPEDLRVSLVDAPGDAAYPISSFTYILAYQEQQDKAKGEALARFLAWALGDDGQKLAPGLQYAPLPARVAEKALAKVRGLTFQGKPLLGEAGR